MDDTVHNHEVEMKKYGYDELSKEADTALENTLDALVKNTDMQKAVIDNMLSQVTASYEGAYGKIQDIIKETGLMVSDAFKDYITSVPDFNTGNPNDYEADDDVSNMDTSQIPGHSQSGQGAIDGADDRNDSSNDASQTHPDGKKYDIKLNKTSVSVEVGKTTTIKAELVPKPAHSQTITWKSEKTSIATVSGGKITGKSRGITKVLASADYVYANATCTVKVLPKNYSENVKGLNSYLSSAGQTLSDNEKEKIIYDSFGASGKKTSAAETKAKEAAKKILVKKWFNGLRDREKGKPIPSGTSALARHFMEKNKSVNRHELYELAKILGVKTPPADQYESWGSALKNKILSEVKKYGYAKGGLVDYGRYIPINTLDELARSNGEWGMVAARRKELILNEHLSELLQTGLPTAVDIIRKFNIDNTSGTGSPRIYNDNTVYEVNIYVDKISNDTDIKKLAHAIDAELTKAHVKDMRKLIG